MAELTWDPSDGWEAAEFLRSVVPEWFLEELKHDGDDMDDAYDSFRVRYGSDTDMDTMRAVCEEARQLLKDLGEN